MSARFCQHEFPLVPAITILVHRIGTLPFFSGVRFSGRYILAQCRESDGDVLGTLSIMLRPRVAGAMQGTGVDNYRDGFINLVVYFI